MYSEKTDMRRSILILLTLLCMAATAAAQQGRTLDRIVAVVGNEIITESELDLQLLRIAMQQKIDVKDPKERRRVLDELLNRKLMLAQAVLDSVEVTEEMVTAQLNEQIRQFELRYGSVQKLEQAAGMSITQMKREFREDIRKNLMIENLQREKFGQITITHREVEEFFAQYRDSLPRVPEQIELRQITMYPKVMESFKETARAKAAQLLDSIRGGADFAALARQFSDDVASAKNGGDLGQARRGLFVKEFEEAAFALQPEQVSDVVESPFGFHIIKMIERKGEAIRCSHILIRVQKTGESDALVKTRLSELRARIVAGEDFATLAKEYSEDVETRQLGGDLGLVEVQQMGSDLQQIQQKLMPGDVSEPTRVSLERDYAFVLVQLVRRVAPHAPTLQDDYTRVQNWAKLYKQNRMYAEWLASLRTSVFHTISL